MKKLLTMIGAAAAAFGLYATAEFPTGTSFESEASITPGETGLWGGAEGATKLDITAYDGSSITAPLNLPAQWSAGAGDKFLDIKTDGFDKPLWGYIDADRVAYPMKDATDNSLFFDGNVQFTAFDDEESVTVPDNTKLMVWVKENTDAQGEPLGTYQLMVTAGKLVESEWVPQNYDCGPITAIDAMKRITIKSLGNIYTTGEAYGFCVYVNGVAVSCNDGKGLDTSKLTNVAKASNQYGYLFPSIVAAATVSAVGFAGQGQLDCLSFTYTPPPFAEDKYFTINWDENVTAVGYKLESDQDYTQCDMTGTSASIPYISAVTYQLSVSYKQNYAAGEWTGDDSVNFGENYATVSVFAPNQSMTIVSKDVTPRIVLLDEDGQPTTTTYATFGQALADVDTAASFKLQQTVTIGATYDDEESFWTTEGQIEGKDITIDLNGQAINGTAGADCFVFNVVGGNLTVIDSSAGATGSINAATGNSGVISVACSGETADASLTINKGTFNGAVEVEGASEGYAAATASIIAGSFDKASNGVTEFALAGYVDPAVSTRDDTVDYFVVKAIPQYAISVTKPDDATVTIVGSDTKTYVDGSTVPAGVTLFITAELSEGDVAYDPAIAVNGVAYDVDNGYTVTDAGVGIVVTKTAHVCQATYYDNDGKTTLDLAPATFTIESTGLTLPPVPAKAGFGAGKWVLDLEDSESAVDDSVYATFAEVGEDLELYAYYEALPAVAKIGDVEYATADAAFAYAFENGGKVEIIADCSFTGSYTNKTADVEINVAENVTLEREGTVIYPFIVAGGKTLTFSGAGTITKAATCGNSTMICVGDADNAAATSANAGTVIIAEGSTIMLEDLGGSNTISIDAGSLIMNGGYVKNGNASGHAIRVSSKLAENDGEAAYIELNAGKLEANDAASPIGCKGDVAPTIKEVAGKDGVFMISCHKKSDPSTVFYGQIKIDLTAGEKILFSNTKSEFAPRGYGYKASETETGWYKLAPTDYTITLVSAKIDDQTSVSYSMDKTQAQTFTLVADDPETGKKFKEWTLVNSLDEEDISISENTLTIGAGAIGNLTITATYEDEAQPVIPGQDVDIPSGETAQSYAEKINDDPTLKAKLLKAPCKLEAADLATYQALFVAAPNATGDGVTFVLEATKAEELAADATADAAEALTGDAISVKAVKGLYYGLKEAGALDSMKVTDVELATGEAIEFKPNKTGNAAFWQVIVSPTAIEMPVE